MKTMFLALAALSLWFVAQPQPAAAQIVPQFPWCASLDDDGGSPESCAFVSQEQCLDYVSGIGGFCYINPALGPYLTDPYVTPRAAVAPRAPRARRNS